VTSPLSVVSLSARAFAALGLKEIAYVRPIVASTGTTFAIHAADGTEVAVVGDRLVAVAMIRRYDLEPSGLH
jgi:hypothetical protein